MAAKGIGTLATVLAVGAAAIALSLGPSEHRAVTAGAPTLTDDDSDQPMFVVPDLAPGASVTRCIAIRHRGGSENHVSLTTRVSGKLADHLQATVALGSGGDFGTCDGFVGRTLFRGPLAEATRGLADEAWRPRGDDDAATYRITISAPRDLRHGGEAARPAFAWASVAGAPPSTPAGEPPVPAPAPAGGDAAGAGPPASPHRPTRRAPSHAGRGPERPAGRPAHRLPRDTGATPDRRPAPLGRPSRGGLARALERAVDAVIVAAAEGGKRATFPVLLLLVMGLFVVVQNRLDRRDPKLALAPVHAQPDLPFSPLATRTPA